MSQALPMTTERRMDIYDRDVPTLRQLRSLARMMQREELRNAGVLTHGATGERIRRPLASVWKNPVSLPPEHGSFRTHIAAYCAPCDIHWRRPRLHRYLNTRPRQLPPRSKRSSVADRPPSPQ